MEKFQFLQSLKDTGYPEPVEVQQPAYGHLGDHTHPFAVQALVLEGSIELEIGGEVHMFKAGDVFHLGYEQLHSETYGPEGVRYLASRKKRA